MKDDIETYALGASAQSMTRKPVDSVYLRCEMSYWKHIHVEYIYAWPGVRPSFIMLIYIYIFVMIYSVICEFVIK